MCARSHTSGLMISVCWLSTSASESCSTSASVLARPSARASVSGGAAISTRVQPSTFRLSYRPARRALRHTSTTSRTDAVRQETRESSGRRLSSKRPVSSCSSSVTSAWKRRPRLSMRTMSPVPIPLAVVRGTAGALGGGSAGPPPLPMEPDVLLAVGADAHDRGAVGGERARQGGAEALDVLGALPAAAVERGGVGEVQAVGRGDVLDELRALAGDRQEVEDAAAVVVEEDDHELQAQAGGGEEAADVVGERDVADQQ